MSDIPQISAEELQKAIEGNNQMIILDVRTPEEYSRGKIKGSINTPLDQIQTGITKAAGDKQATICVYCLSGSRSIQAAQALIEMGYTNVFSLTSGLLAWRAKQYQLEN